MAETPWWAALGAAAVLGTGTYLAAGTVPRKRDVVGSRAYRIRGRRKTEVVALVVHDGERFGVEWDFPNGLRSAEGRIFEVPLDLWPENMFGFASVRHAEAYADGQMERLPWFSAYRG